MKMYEMGILSRADMKMHEMEILSQFSIIVVTETHQQFTFAKIYDDPNTLFYKQLQLGSGNQFTDDYKVFITNIYITVA